MTGRCLAMVALVLGLVLMHHAVIAAPPAAATPSVEHATGHGTEHAAHAAPAPAPPDHGHGDHHGATMLHLCLAVLAALGVLLLVARHARRPSPSGDDRDDDTPAGVVPAPARPPPVPLRLARLQVLRL